VKADQTLFAHGDADNLRGERAVFDQLQHGKIVGEFLCCRDDFDIVGREGFDPFGGVIQALGLGEVMKADEQG
jgi:hypothetical protein